MKKIVFILIIALTLGVIVFPVAKATYAQAAVTVTTKYQLNLRSGPGSAYSTLATVPEKTTLPALGRDAARQWVQVTYNNLTGWLSVSFLTVTGNLSTLPVVGAPTVQPSATATVKATKIPPTPTTPKATKIPPTPTTPKPTKIPPTPVIRLGREITTPKGILYVSKVKASASFPEDCPSAGRPCQFSANPGYTLLYVYFKIRGKGSFGEIYQDLSASRAWSQSYLVPDGADAAAQYHPRVMTYTTGTRNGVKIDDFALVYPIPDSARKFKLYWPGNAPVAVNR